MTNILLLLILIVLSAIGYIAYKILLVIKIPMIKPVDVEVGVTRGVYAPVTVSNNENSTVGISEAKTPQLIEFEAEQELLKRTQAMGR